MEIVLPFVALGGMYIISNRTSESFTGNDEGNTGIPNGLIKDEVENQTDERLADNAVEDARQTTDEFFNADNYTVNDYNSLSGEKISKENFKHNNMVPFFGAKIKGNYDNYKHSESVLDHMTGSGSQMKSKSESAPLFTPAENMNFAYGAPNMNDFYQSRVNPSMKMSNVKPWQEQRVAPGLNKGFTTEGGNGLNSALDERSTYMPRTVDELRVATNPKQSYCLSGHEGPLSAPVKERGQFGAMEKHLPDTYYESGQERWFTTTGIEKKQTARSEIIDKEENRATTTREYEGGAKGRAHINYSKKTYTPSTRVELGSEQFTPATSSVQGANHPNGHKSYLTQKNNRVANNNSNGFGIVGSTLGAVISPLIDVLRPSRKENVIGNIRLHGDVVPTAPNSYLSNQNEIRVTNRQMHPDTLPHHNIQNQGDGGYEVTTNTVVPTARNETSTYYSGVMGGTSQSVSTYEAAYGQTNNDKKEATTYNRVPMGNTNSFVQLPQEHSVVKQETDRENNRMFVPTTNPTQLPPSLETCGLTNTPQQLQENNRIEPDLLEAFKKNPYTQSLQSVA